MAGSERPMKRARRNNRVTADLYNLLTFPVVEEVATPLVRPFREGVKEFLSRHARIVFCPASSPFSSIAMACQILLRVGDLVEGPEVSPVVVALDVFEEDVTGSARRRRSVYCNHCRVVGWSGNPVCRKRYHFIIRAKGGSPAEGYEKPCTRCGNLLHLLSESRCKCCGNSVNAEDVEDWVCSQFDDNTHLLHGVVHSNGFGHLIRVNGREGGSKVVSGSDIMNFWDRLCTTVGVRKVSVMDVSRKYGVEYRLLHAITRGHSWYGNWGYEFGRGSYALTLQTYEKAVKLISSVPLAPFLLKGRGQRTRLQAVIAFYKSLADSELVTVKDLLSFLLALVQQSNNPSIPEAATKNIKTSAPNILCAWTRNDVLRVQQNMIKVLLASSSKGNWVTRHALKRVMCKTASPELIDYSLKHLGGILTPDGMVVRQKWNPISSDVEFRLEPLSVRHCGDGLDLNRPSKEHIKLDLKFLIDSLVHPETMVSYGPQVMRETVIESATKLLDCKQFIKDYWADKKIVKDPFAINILCHVELPDLSKEGLVIPPELLVLQSDATIADLKKEATKAFQEVYAMFKRLDVDKLLGYGSIDDSFTVNFLVGQNGSVTVKGICPSKYGVNHFKMERGTENWKVDCTCGAKDDDGESMLACDSCGVWQHIRCAGIDKTDEIPKSFQCTSCMNSYPKKPGKIHKCKEASTEVFVSRTSTCRGEAVEADGVGLRAKLAI